MTTPKTFRRILWWGNVRALSVADRAAFAARHGFDALNIAPADIVDLLENGETLSSIRAMAEDRGVAFTYLDPVIAWLPDWTPGPDAADFVPFLAAGEGRELEFCQGLGIDRVLTITPFPEGRYSITQLAECLAAYAETMDRHAITCVLEAMPMWGLKTLAEVEELRRATASGNIRILFDTWHYMRGGRDDALLAQIPRGVIDHVQVADGSLHTPKGRSLFDDCLNHRLPPGEGQLPLTQILSALDRAGHLNSMGPEVFSTEFDQLTADAIADRLIPAFEKTLDQAQTQLTS